MDEITNRSNATNDKIGSGVQGQLGFESKSSTNRNGNNSLKRSLTEEAEDQVTLSKGMLIILDCLLAENKNYVYSNLYKIIISDHQSCCPQIDVRVINDLIEDLGRLETAKSQVQLRMHTGNAPEIQRKSVHNPSINYRPHLTSHSSAFGISGSVELSPSFGSKSSVNQNHKKMMDNEIESVQFNRKRMNSTVSNSSGARSISGDPSRYGDQVRNVVQSKTAVSSF